jgi:NADPH:quinone reductase-like Zn-dependent oxidoreductase
MKAAIVSDLGQEPAYGDFADPIPAAGESGIAVSAAALSPVTRSRALGTHYSSGGAYPFVVGIDGVGWRDDGARVYFVLPRVPFGAMAERTVVRQSHCVPVPDDVDDVTAAAIANPGMSSWAAFTARAHLNAGETVLVNGATGAAGRLAVQIARHLGARKVIATGRNVATLQEVEALGADVTVPLVENDETLESRLMEQFSQRVDVVIDYLWGKSAEAILIAGAKAGVEGVPMRFVQVGSTSGPNINLPSAVLRSSAIEMMGSGIGSVSLDRLVRSVEGVLRATGPAGLRIATRTVPMSQIEKAWGNADTARRTVVTMSSRRAD